MDSSIKVKQEVIDRIKKMGMSNAIKAANSGSEGAEFVEGAKRFYGNRVSGSASPERNKAAGRPTPSVGDKENAGPPTVKMPPSAPAAATRRIGGPPEEFHEERYNKPGKKLPKGKSIFDRITDSPSFKEDRYKK